MRTLQRVMFPLALLSLALPALAKTYKYSYPNACGDIWGAVKTVLADEKSYVVKGGDDPHLKADYQPKHEVQFDVSGVLLQRMNHVTLVEKGTGCEMQVVSNYSGWGHDDQSDFKKRVDDALLKPKGPAATRPLKITQPEKTAQAEPAKPQS
jgi:hypothetical protein